MGAGMERSNTEPTLAKFLCNLSSVGLKALLLISVASMIGIETTSFIAVLGAAAASGCHVTAPYGRCTLLS